MHFPELCQPSRSESYFFGPQQSHSNLISKQEPREWTTGTRKKSALWKEKNHLPTKPSTLWSSIPLSVSSHPSSWILQSQCAQGTKHGVRTQPGKFRWGFFQAKVGKCGQKSWEIFMETTKGDTDLWDKNWKKTIQVEISIGYIVAQKRRKRKGKFFAVYRFRMYFTECLHVWNILVLLHQALWDSRISGFQVAR